MKCHILFSEKNKKNIINLSSAENAQRVVKVNVHKNIYYGYSLEKPQRGTSNEYPQCMFILLVLIRSASAQHVFREWYSLEVPQHNMY